MSALITAIDFANPVGPSGQYRFGLNRVAAARELHNFADKIASGECVLQKVTYAQEASPEEYTMSTLTIIFVEKNPAPDNLENAGAIPVGGLNRRIQVES